MPKPSATSSVSDGIEKTQVRSKSRFRMENSSECNLTYITDTKKKTLRTNKYKSLFDSGKSGQKVEKESCEANECSYDHLYVSDRRLKRGSVDCSKS